VTERRKRGRPSLSEKAAKCFFGRNARPQRQHVNEQSDQRFQLDTGSAGDGGSDQKVVTSRISVHEDVECGQQREEERRFFLPAQFTKPVREPIG
jgi:hypothetical protein